MKKIVEDTKNEIETVPESEDIDRRIDVLSLVISDLRVEYEAARVENNENEDDAADHATLDIVTYLISEAVHTAAHGLGYSSVNDYNRLLRGILETALQGTIECVNVIEHSDKCAECTNKTAN